MTAVERRCGDQPHAWSCHPRCGCWKPSCLGVDDVSLRGCDDRLAETFLCEQVSGAPTKKLARGLTATVVAEAASMRAVLYALYVPLK